MAAPSFTNEFEAQLKEAGKKLSVPPSSTMELLDLLDRAEDLLSHVWQTPSKSMGKALVPSMGALISDQLLRHPEVDVKVSVASCLSEITRISAPEAPYNDKIMKEIFQLYLIAFGKLSDASGRCYSKALHILEVTASVRSCLLILDLEFGDIIVAMFQNFFATIRSNHQRAVFSNMEAIMTLTIEESDEVSIELLMLLLSSVEKNQKVSPISWKLGVKVLNNCAGKLKAYLPEVMHLMSLNPDNYADVVATICQDTRPKEHEAEGCSTDAGSPRKIAQSVDESSRSAMEKGTENETSVNMSSCHQTRTGQRNRSQTETEQPELDAEFSKKRERKPSFWLDGYWLIEENASEARHHCQKVKLEKCRKNRATSGQELVSPSDTSTKIGGNHSSIASKRKSNIHEEKVVFHHCVQDSTRACEMNEYGEELVGRRIKVWWPLDDEFYNGAIVAFDLSEKHTVLYDDGDQEILNLCDEQWKLLRDLPPDQEQTADPPHPSVSSDKCPKKKRQ